MYLYVGSVFRLWDFVLKWSICVLILNVGIVIICSFTFNYMFYFSLFRVLSGCCLVVITKNAARETELEREEENKTYTHDTDSQRNWQRMWARETQVLTPVTGSIFRPLSQTHFSKSEFKRLLWFRPRMEKSSSRDFFGSAQEWRNRTNRLLSFRPKMEKSHSSGLLLETNRGCVVK